MNRLNVLVFLIACLVPAMGACASAGGAGAAGDGGIPVVVENNVVPPNTFTVWVVKDGGIRQRLGNLTSNSTGRYRFRVPGIGSYRLVAEPRTGSPVQSTAFELTDASTRVEWDMGAGSVVVR